jgi:hypothetical protein
LLGSCFSENIGYRLNSMKFNCEVNSFGVVYHPAPLAKLLEWTLQERIVGPEDIMEIHGKFFQFMFHTRFNAVLPEDVIDAANQTLKNTKEYIAKCKYVIITPGTAFAYHFSETDEVVSNCHKVPSRLFTRKLYQKEELVNAFQSIRNSILEINPQVQFVFTLSPVRHLKDGMVENNLSKARLLDAIHSIVENNSECHYFPAYELMMDDLRDYRFYTDDMIHPSHMAVEYIWDYLSESLFSDKTRELNHKIYHLQKSFQHRAFNNQTPEYKRFLEKLKYDCTELMNRYPFIDFSEELRELE